MDKYYVSDATGGREVPITKREDPLKQILVKPEAQKTSESTQKPVPATEAVIETPKADFEAVSEAVVPEPPKKMTYGHCNNCRVEMTDDTVVKNAIDWIRAEDGTLTKAASRFSVFCKNCMKFITIIDREAQKLLNEMIRKGAR